MKQLKFFPLLLLFMLLACPAHALIVDYAYVNSLNYDSLGQGVYDQIGQQTWYFTHASVGGNMIGGMDGLHSSDPNKYQLTTPYAGNVAPGTIVPGSVYDDGRGNPGWQAKYDYFEDAVTAGGWGLAVDFVMDKLCYIDGAADPDVYIAMMERLEANTSQVTATVVWATMPLTTGNNAQREAYNDAVRAYAAANNKLLFDIADLEAHDGSSTTPYTNTNGIPVLFSGWTSDGGHLNAAGAEWVAKGWYALAASQTPIPGAIWLLGSGLLGLVGLRRRLRD